MFPTKNIACHPEWFCVALAEQNCIEGRHAILFVQHRIYPSIQFRPTLRYGRNHSGWHCLKYPPRLLKILRSYHKLGKREVAIVTHFEHPTEITKDSLEAVKKIKTDPETKNIPVFMLSAKGQMEDLDQAFVAGADNYITKPFDVEKLNAKIIYKMKKLVEWDC